MAESPDILKRVDIDWLKQAYFSDPERRLALKKGDVLLGPNEINKRLFLILDGSISGYIENEGGDRFEIFRSSEGQFVGTYSYFSNSHRSYSTVVAAEDSLLAYIEQDQPVVRDVEGRSFAEHFLPVIVEEIYARQLLTQKISLQNLSAMKKLFQAEKMATLGQLAAGLAHELNNAIGVIQRKSEWIAHRVERFLRERDAGGLYYFFEKGANEGQSLSTAEIRARRKELEKKLGIDRQKAQKLSEMGLSDEELAPYISQLSENFDRIYDFYQIGLTIHDMQLASKHAARVVYSVRELGATGKNIKRVATDVNLTIREALFLLRRLTRDVQVNLSTGNIPNIAANPGELVQVWINLIKNACESMLSEKDPAPRLDILTRIEGEYIIVQIRDNGPGIAPEILPRIFQPDVTTKVAGLTFGFGLGLSIVQRLIESYHGTISVTSVPGKTIFEVRLPKA